VEIRLHTFLSRHQTEVNGQLHAASNLTQAPVQSGPDDKVTKFLRRLGAEPTLSISQYPDANKSILPAYLKITITYSTWHQS
jgi:hypothetical protein